jgi:periplasmic protein TonB
MADKKRKPSQKHILIGSVAFILGFICLSAFLVSLLLTDNVQQNMRKTHQVRLLKPPPPPELKEKPPPPPEQKKIEHKILEEKPDQDDQKEEENPENKSLGIDAEGEAGSDSFGLEAREGGRPIIGGSGGGSLMRQFAWYNQLVEKTIRDQVDEILKEHGGAPDGDLRTVVDLFLDDQGRIERYEIYKSSGNEKMDNIIETAVKATIISKQPPKGMPRGMRLTIASKG